MNLIQFLRIFWARKWMLVLTALACFVVATAVASFLPKRYPATARVMLDVGNPDPVMGSGLPAGRAGRDFIRTQIELMRDDRIAGSVVDRLGLANDPATIAAYQRSGFRDEDGGIRRWLAGQIRARTSAGLVAGSSIMEIRFEGPTPEYARTVVGAIRDAYIDETLRLKTDSAGKSSAWYREQAEREKAELDAAEGRRTAFMRENNIVLTGGPGSPDVEVARLESLQSAVAQARATMSASQMSATAASAVNPTADALRVQLSAIEEEIARASEQLGTAHPAYRAAQARKRVVEQQLANAMRNQAAAVGAVSGAAQQAVARLESDLKAQSELVQARKPLYDQLLLLDREIELKRRQYEATVARSNALRLEADVDESSLTVLGDPVAERTPSYPKVPLVAGLSALLGLGLGIVAALIAEFIARRVRGAEDLAYATGAPVLVSVGAPPPSPFRLQLRRLLGRRERRDDEPEMQAI
ncbi:MAG: Wzz/FepE/Etk N-terminal domain-containing protein [Sphingomonadaceae bacterium]